jgi:hypothetical protein
MSGIEKEVHPPDQRSSASFANGKGSALHEETAHEAAERGIVATDKYVTVKFNLVNLYLFFSSDTAMRSSTSIQLPRAGYD